MLLRAKIQRLRVCRVVPILDVFLAVARQHRGGWRPIFCIALLEHKTIYLPNFIEIDRAVSLQVR